MSHRSHSRSRRHSTDDGSRHKSSKQQHHNTNEDAEGRPPGVWTPRESQTQGSRGPSRDNRRESRGGPDRTQSRGKRPHSGSRTGHLGDHERQNGRHRGGSHGERSRGRGNERSRDAGGRGPSRAGSSRVDCIRDGDREGSGGGRSRRRGGQEHGSRRPDLDPRRQVDAPYPDHHRGTSNFDVDRQGGGDPREEGTLKQGLSPGNKSGQRPGRADAARPKRGAGRSDKQGRRSPSQSLSPVSARERTADVAPREGRSLSRSRSRSHANKSVAISSTRALPIVGPSGGEDDEYYTDSEEPADEGKKLPIQTNSSHLNDDDPERHRDRQRDETGFPNPPQPDRSRHLSHTRRSGGGSRGDDEGSRRRGGEFEKDDRYEAQRSSHLYEVEQDIDEERDIEDEVQASSSTAPWRMKEAARSSRAVLTRPDSGSNPWKKQRVGDRDGGDDRRWTDKGSSWNSQWSQGGWSGRGGQGAHRRDQGWVDDDRDTWQKSVDGTIEETMWLAESAVWKLKGTVKKIRNDTNCEIQVTDTFDRRGGGFPVYLTGARLSVQSAREAIDRLVSSTQTSTPEKKYNLPTPPPHPQMKEKALLWPTPTPQRSKFKYLPIPQSWTPLLLEDQGEALKNIALETDGKVEIFEHKEWRTGFAAVLLSSDNVDAVELAQMHVVETCKRKGYDLMDEVEVHLERSLAEGILGTGLIKQLEQDVGVTISKEPLEPDAEYEIFIIRGDPDYVVKAKSQFSNHAQNLHASKEDSFRTDEMEETQQPHEDTLQQTQQQHHDGQEQQAQQQKQQIANDEEGSYYSDSSEEPKPEAGDGDSGVPKAKGDGADIEAKPPQSEQIASIATAAGESVLKTVEGVLSAKAASSGAAKEPVSLARESTARVVAPPTVVAPPKPVTDSQTDGSPPNSEPTASASRTEVAPDTSLDSASTTSERGARILAAKAAAQAAALAASQVEARQAAAAALASKDSPQEQQRREGEDARQQSQQEEMTSSISKSIFGSDSAPVVVVGTPATSSRGQPAVPHDLKPIVRISSWTSTQPTPPTKKKTSPGGLVVPPPGSTISGSTIPPPPKPPNPPSGTSNPSSPISGRAGGWQREPSVGGSVVKGGSTITVGAGAKGSEHMAKPPVKSIPVSNAQRPAKATGTVMPPPTPPKAAQSSPPAKQCPKTVLPQEVAVLTEQGRASELEALVKKRAEHEAHKQIVVIDDSSQPESMGTEQDESDGKRQVVVDEFDTQTSGGKKGDGTKGGYVSFSSTWEYDKGKGKAKGSQKGKSGKKASSASKDSWGDKGGYEKGMVGDSVHGKSGNDSSKDSSSWSLVKASGSPSQPLSKSLAVISLTKSNQSSTGESYAAKAVTIASKAKSWSKGGTAALDDWKEQANYEDTAHSRDWQTESSEIIADTSCDGLDASVEPTLPSAASVPMSKAALAKPPSTAPMSKAPGGGWKADLGPMSVADTPAFGKAAAADLPEHEIWNDSWDADGSESVPADAVHDQW